MFEFHTKLISLVLLLVIQNAIVRCEIDYNTINEDGSFSFRHTNDDIGSYYHSATGSPDNIVRGRYGSRNPATGQVEETVYTAGPRGFRVNGPKIHRKMDIAQFPILPRGSPDDPLADPFDDPTYSFNFRTPDQSRSEDNDATNRVRGLYSYIDDVGERHSVRYAAGAGTGFEVSNAVPDSPASVAYSSPLYKAHPQTRGKMSVQRGPNGSYKLIAAGPDHRRAESRGSDGLVRGTYSYLDDKGVQRTVEYIAGAGIGYRVVQNSIGPGTHINPSVADLRLSDTDFKLANEFGTGAGGGLSGGATSGRGSGSRGSVGGNRGGGGGSTDGEYLKKAGSGRDRHKEGDEDQAGTSIGDDEEDGDNFGNEAGSEADSRERSKTDRMGTAAGRRGGTRYRGSGSSNGNGGASNGNGENDFDDGKGDAKFDVRGGSRPSSNRNSVAGDSRERERTRYRNRDRVSGTGSRGGSSSASGGGRGGGGGANYGGSSTSNDNYNFNDDDVGSLPPLITANRKILEIDRERDWVERHRDSTVIKNVGKWYIGLPPGQSVRAHVQNIDLLPLGGRRVQSPSEALRQDEIADMVASLESSGSSSSLSSAYRGS